MKRNAFYLGLFVFALSCYQYFKAEPQQTQVAHVSGPDFTAELLQSKVFNLKGQLHYVLDSDYLERFESRNETVFTRPSILFYPEIGDPQWRIDALDGVMREDNLAIFRNQATVTNLQPNPQLERLVSKELQFELNQETVHSDYRVDLYGPTSHQRGIGMDGDLASETVSLHQAVKATYLNENK
ncbi:LPS export ABC transporter periplasmic protein LptC [Alginatibacterium sediminis]|uniref:LPS export ABC transporter periplasmic protein LptC n=1 Tax=Alginatibacterium sediminis TaxID=2164068 RepID=A0A420E903_9ALTE|nr:LPS export ABC transporter periplasmic protein LptC [Alginatibacterium sediminis]RKF15915.1 LPS export ABC transporter periplasmic protein LptC [Alginatibacterium sediminis]